MIRAISSIVLELFSFLWARKMWWMIPIVGILLIMSTLMVTAQSSAIAPLIYTLF